MDMPGGMRVGGGILKVCGPGKSDKQPHEQGSYKRITDMIKKADGKEAEDKRERLVPIPEILVQEVKRQYTQDHEDSPHRSSLRRMFRVHTTYNV
jgi:hypothetical protein